VVCELSTGVLTTTPATPAFVPSKTIPDNAGRGFAIEAQMRNSNTVSRRTNFDLGMLSYKQPLR
jgi:hypothetical protein